MKSISEKDPLELQNFMGKYRIGHIIERYQDSSLEVIGYKTRTMIFERCCHRGMLEIRPRVKDKKTNKEHYLCIKVHLCLTCNKNHNDVSDCMP